MNTKEVVESMIKKVGHPVAYQGSWDDNAINVVVRGKDSYLLLDTHTSCKGTISIVRYPLRLNRKDKKFFMNTRSHKFRKYLVRYGRGYVPENELRVGYVNAYKWLLQNKYFNYD